MDCIFRDPQQLGIGGAVDMLTWSPDLGQRIGRVNVCLEGGHEGGHEGGGDK